MTDPSGARSAVVDYAKAQIGKPYSLGAAGPSAFDCSGLTMRAWQAAGYTLPHYTVAQYESVQRVPIGQAQPGDLVFFGGFNPVTGEPHHVGIYVGPNQMIDAPDYNIPVGMHDYTTYGDVMDTVGRMPVIGSDTTPVISDTASVQSVSLLSTFKDTYGIVASGNKLAGKLTNGTMWTRIGIGVIGVVIIVMMMRMARNG